MNKKEKEILNIEQSFKDTLENEIVEQNTENKKVEIKDIKYVGKATWKDKVNGKDISDAVFIVEKQIKEIDERAFIIVSQVEEVSGYGFTYSKEMREVLS